jgi:hypothetical protein
MKKKVIPILLLLLLIVVTTAYFRRGGMAAPQLSKVQTQPFYMLATHYKGVMAQPKAAKALQSKIRQTHDLLNTGKIKGTLALVYESNPDQTKDSVLAYIGVIVPDSLQINLPQGYAVHNFPQMRVVRAEIKAHVSLAPNPNKTNQMLRDFARKSGLKIGNRHIEKYISEEHIIAEIAVE